MLKFLDNRKNEKPSKSPIKYQPQMIYGISAQAPTQFQTPYTIIHKKAYVNPYLKFERNRSSLMNQKQVQNVEPDWINKVNLQLVEQQKIVSSQKDDQTEALKSRYNKSYYDEFNSIYGRFKKTRGEFTNFIEKNNHYKSMGPIHGEQRTNSRISLTKKSVWFKPKEMLSSEIPAFNKTATHLNFPHKSSQATTISRNMSALSNNSKMLTEKTRIRDNRKKTNQRFQEDIDQRKKKCLHVFELPKIQSEMKMKKKVDKVESLSCQKKESEELGDLDSFERNLKKKFR